jgi:hypothetical protein
MHNFEVKSIISDAIANGVESDRNLLDVELLDISVDKCAIFYIGTSSAS